MLPTPMWDSTHHPAQHHLLILHCDMSSFKTELLALFPDMFPDKWLEAGADKLAALMLAEILGFEGAEEEVVQDPSAPDKSCPTHQRPG